MRGHIITLLPSSSSSSLSTSSLSSSTSSTLLSSSSLSLSLQKKNRKKEKKTLQSNHHPLPPLSPLPPILPPLSLWILEGKWPKGRWGLTSSHPLLPPCTQYHCHHHPCPFLCRFLKGGGSGRQEEGRWWSGGERGWSSCIMLWLPKTFNMGHMTHIDFHSPSHRIHYNTVNNFSKIL